VTEAESNALAERLAAIGFRFGPGVRDTQGRTWGPDLLFRQHPHDRLDLRDPATCGVIIARVNQATLYVYARDAVRLLEEAHVAQSG
jgi:hypothetical protein